MSHTHLDKQAKMSLIVAITKNTRAIGSENKLLWRIPEDFKRFKAITMGHPMIMGRKTYESIGRPLPGRTSIVVSRSSTIDHPEVITVRSIDEAVTKAKELDQQEIFICGGAQIYEQMLPLADKLYITVVETDVEADTFFPPYEHMFTKEISREERSDENYKYTFLELER